MFALPRNLILLVNRSRQQHLKYTGCNTRTVCLYNTNAYFLLQMAARGERNIESNQFAIDVSHCTLCQVQKLVVCYKQFRKEVSTCLQIYIYILSLIMQWIDRLIDILNLVLFSNPVLLCNQIQVQQYLKNPLYVSFLILEICNRPGLITQSYRFTRQCRPARFVGKINPFHQIKSKLCFVSQ